MGGIANQMIGWVGDITKKGSILSMVSELIFFTHQIWQMRMNSTQQPVILIDLKNKNEMHYYAKGQCQPIEKRQK